MSGRLKFPFDREKAIEVVLYIANRIPDPTYHSINKVLYAADKISLSKYGRMICGGKYYAMMYGAVPSETYTLMKSQENPTGEDVGFGVQNQMEIRPTRQANLDLLSGADIKCIDEALTVEGDADFRNRTNRSHDEAYHEAWDNKPAEAKRSIMPLESIIAMLDNGDEVLDHLLNRR